MAKDVKYSELQKWEYATFFVGRPWADILERYDRYVYAFIFSNEELKQYCE